MLAAPAPSDQRVEVRPISFVLEGGASISRQVMLPIRPEDLTRTEPSRATIHQTIGRDVQGWVDHFGEGLPSISISGTTGWRYKQGTGMDGAQSFEDLNQLVVHDYPAAKQAAIDSGSDPARVKLLFVDVLDRFVFPVVPTQFVLRRSKSRPLLFQYNITLQALSTSVDSLPRYEPFFGTISAGTKALTAATATLEQATNGIDGLVSSVVSAVNGALAPIGALAKQFMSVTTKVFTTVTGVIRSAKNGVNAVANNMIGIAADLAQAGVNIFRTIAAIQGIPATLKASLSRVAGAYNEVVCIFSNSLRRRRTYEEYSGLYGASNCSSTTGGRPASAYLGTNAFEMIQPDRGPVGVSTMAITSLAAVNRSDPVLSPMPLPAVQQHLGNIVGGIDA